MVFTEPVFLFLFLPVLLALYGTMSVGGFITSRRALFLEGQNWILLLFSLAFYAYGEQLFVLVMLALITVNYVCGLAIERCRGRSGARLALIISIAFNLTLLASYKYATFAVANLNALFSAMGLPEISIGTVLLPIGISFFTFQAMSYTIDVYRGTAECQKRLSHLALYISLFPQLIAGPIVRYHDISRQLSERVVSSDLFASGVRRFLLGLGKKMILANTMAVPVDRLFSQSDNELTFYAAWLGTLAYAFQIYFDFSGYSDMAIGLGRMFGFRFLENFNFPYISQSITEFWRRWHISLSTWFRDYLYIPLGGNRGTPLRTCGNLVTVFLLCGLWHGASWTFIIWGLYHGAFLILERTGVSQRLQRAPALLRHLYVMLVVLVGWCIFRCESVIQLSAFLTAMTGANGWIADSDRAIFHGLEFWSVLVVCAVLSTPVIKHLRHIKTLAQTTAIRRSLWNAAEFSGLSLIFLFSTVLIAAGTYNPFIYFRF